MKKSIEVMQKDGLSDKIIKKKMMESFSMEEETADRVAKMTPIYSFM